MQSTKTPQINRYYSYQTGNMIFIPEVTLKAENSQNFLVVLPSSKYLEDKVFVTEKLIWRTYYRPLRTFA